MRTIIYSCDLCKKEGEDVKRIEVSFGRNDCANFSDISNIMESKWDLCMACTLPVAENYLSILRGNNAKCQGLVEYIEFNKKKLKERS